MWEEPRPERIRGVDAGRNRAAPASIFPIVLVIGVIALLTKGGILDRIRGSNEKVAPAVPSIPYTPREQPNPTAVTPRPPPEPARTTPRDAVPARSGTTSRGDPGVLRTLTETCRYWTSQNTRGQYSANQQLACRDMMNYAREHGMSVPSVGGSGPSLPRPTRAPAASTQMRVQINECEGHGYGSIAYRQCRSKEKQRLTDWCKWLRSQRNSTRGAHYEQLRTTESAVCSKADRYEIVQ